MIRQLPTASHITLLKEAVRSGTIASLVMMPFGFLFKALNLRVGHYGPMLGEFLFGLLSEPWMQVLLRLSLAVTARPVQTNPGFIPVRQKVST